LISIFAATGQIKYGGLALTLGLGLAMFSIVISDYIFCADAVSAAPWTDTRYVSYI